MGFGGGNSATHASLCSRNAVKRKKHGAVLNYHIVFVLTLLQLSHHVIVLEEASLQNVFVSNT